MNSGIIARKFPLCVLALAFCISSITAFGQMQANQTTSGTAQLPSAPADNALHVDFTPYLWFAGMNGTAGAMGYQTKVDASFGDLFKYLNIGLMGELEARKKRVLMNTDFLWMKLSDDKALPVNEIGINSIKAKVNEFMLTPEVGYRVVDKATVKVDAYAGVRYWHLGESLGFSPEVITNVSTSQNWADVVGGARIHVPLSQKAMFTIAGDAGGGGANSDYQVAGLLDYKLKKCTLHAGWRYLPVDYRNSNGFIYDTATSGALLGVTFKLK